MSARNFWTWRARSNKTPQATVDTPFSQAESLGHVEPEHLAELLDSISDPIFIVDESWKFTFLNRPLEDAWCRKRVQVVGREIWDEFPALLGTRVSETLTSSARERRRLCFACDVPGLGALEGEAYPWGAGVCVHLRTSADRRQRYAPVEEQIVWAEERERQRIARELHDGTTQLITAITIGLSNIADVSTLKEAQIRARRLRAIGSRVLKEVGRLTRGLDALDLREDGLHAALIALVLDWKESYGIELTFDFDGLENLVLPATTQISIYRIVQEALSNVARHSGATRTSVSVHLRNPRLEVTIDDDGNGFSVDHVPDRPGVHLGLRFMCERAELLGGTFHVTSSERSGTSVHASIPIPELPAKAS